MEINDAIIARFELYPAETKLLQRFINGERFPETPTTSEKVALSNLEARALIKVKDGTVDLTPFWALTQTVEDDEDETPEAVIIFRPLSEQVLGLVKSAPNSAAGLARVYQFVFGRETKQYPALGKIANELGVRRAALFFLEHCLFEFEGEEPLKVLLPKALSLAGAVRNGGYRPEEAPTEDEQRRERVSAEETAWRLRMQKWLDFGGEVHALATIAYDGAEQDWSVSQIAATQRQIELDFQHPKAAAFIREQNTHS